jgi:hypothetical protein
VSSPPFQGTPQEGFGRAAPTGFGPPPNTSGGASASMSALGQPGYGGGVGNGPLTPELIRATAASGTPPNRRSLIYNSWELIEVDRPSVIVPIDATYEPILYCYGRPGHGTLDSQISTKGGVCFLSSPGKWYVKTLEVGAYAYGASGANFTTFDVLIVDAWHPGVLAKYLGRGGANWSGQEQKAITSSAIPTHLVHVNPLRSSLLIQSVPSATGVASGPVRISIAEDDQYLINGGGPSGRGLLLLNGGSILLSDSSLVRREVTAIVATAGGASALIEVVEWSDVDPLTVYGGQ